MEITKIDITRLDEKSLEQWFKDQEIPAFRGRQVYQWLWQKGVTSFDQMTNLNKNLRESLSNHFIIPKTQVDKVQNSRDGTIKTRIKLFDDNMVESVLIPVPDENRFTACISSQVGCSLSCSFCATGKMKRVRNLSAKEIVDQYQIVQEQSLHQFGHPLTNIVYMGMGEPLLNYREVLNSISALTDPKVLGLSPRRITISTAGIAKMIRRLADDNVKFNLALSLHAADDSKRNKIMPINEQNNLAILIDALTHFHQKCKGKITYEYIAFDQFNDTLQDAENLVKLCHNFPVRVNIIEYNPIQGFDGKKSDPNRLDKFAAYLQKKRIRVTIRRSRGKDIDAACGQLANQD